MQIHAKDYRVRQGDEVDLRTWPTRMRPVYKSKSHYQEILADHVAHLSAQQQLLYACNRHAVLLIFQAMDAAGKDGAIKHVMSGVNPQGCQVFSFKHPSAVELQHDFLWRTTRDLPGRGQIGIFNRSYYKEQRKRFLERIDQPEKNWKFSQADMAERKFWKQYQKAYEQCLSATSTGDAPWYIVPADDKDSARIIVSRIVLDTLEELGMSYPEVSAARRSELLAIRKRLARS